MHSLSEEPYEDNWLALAAAILATEERSVGEILTLIGLSVPYVHEGQEKLRRRDEEIVRRHEEGVDVLTIALELGVHKQTVYNALHGAGIRLRKPKYGERK